MANGATSDPATPDRTIRSMSNAPDEIAVAIPHVDLVLDALDEHGREEQRDDRLGLVRVRIDGVDEAAARFASRVTKAGGGPLTPGDLTDASDLDVLLAGVRLHFADRWGGWTPTMGKNRELVGGEGTPAVKWLGDDDPPEPAPGLGEPYAASPRDVGHGGEGTRIGILDTKLAPDVTLDGTLLVRAGDVLEVPDGPWSFRLGHGTFLAGLVHQFAPAAVIDPEPVLTGHDATTTSWDLAVALLDLVKPGADGRSPVDVVVMSLGCFTRDGLPPLVLKTAVDMVRDDVVLLAAGGNYADMSMREIRTTGITRRTPMWPAALDGVTAVGSHGADGARSAFSPCVPWIDLTAPGERLSSTYLSGPVAVPVGQGTGTIDFKGFATWSGSSMSAAVAAGRLAVLRDGDEPLRRTLGRLVAAGDAPYVRDVDAC